MADTFEQKALAAMNRAVERQMEAMVPKDAMAEYIKIVIPTGFVVPQEKSNG